MKIKRVAGGAFLLLAIITYLMAGEGPLDGPVGLMIGVIFGTVFALAGAILIGKSILDFRD